VFAQDASHMRFDDRLIFVTIRHLKNRVRAEIRSHHHDGVREINSATVSIGEATFIEHL
jgi:hypothetical protein